jgi:predicted short-subunit dehydrogenase-like oxidoreductase (DUF2520 family)
MAGEKRIRFAVVGAGRVGPVLGRILAENGHRPTAVISRTLRSARSGARFVGCRMAARDLRRIPEGTDLILLAVPHAGIGAVAEELARRREDFTGVAVCHASGIHTAEILAPVERKGGTTFSFHPLQTFPRDLARAAILPSARGIPFGIDGSRAGLRWGRRLARMLGGSAILIPPETRILYHAACVVSSNHLTTMLWIVERMFRAVGAGRPAPMRAVGPIVTATLANVLSTSPARALSGPVARGGVETLAEHLESVRRSLPELLPYFAAVSRETIALAEVKGSASPEAIRAMRQLLEPFIPHH